MNIIQLLDDSRIKKEPNGDLVVSVPKYYGINHNNVQMNFAFSHKEDLNDWVQDECIHYQMKKEGLEMFKWLE